MKNDIDPGHRLIYHMWIAYIANQEVHHQKRDFQDEMRAMFRRHKIEWDERYVWD